MSALTGSLFFDPTAAADGSNVGAFIRAGSDGDLIASQTIALEEWLNVASALHDGAGNPINSTAGAIDIHLASGSFSHAEDSAHTTGDEGLFSLSVRVDDIAAVPASVLADTEGDYQAFISGPNGELLVGAKDLDIRALSQSTDSVSSWTKDGAGNSIDSTAGALNVHIESGDLDDDLANTAIENTATPVSLVAVDVVSSALADRKHLFIANLGSKKLFFGKSGVTVATGFPLFPREKMAARIGPAIAPQMIGDVGASAEDVRVMELS